MKASEATGKRFGRLVVERLVYKDKYYHAYVLCRCDCGNSSIVLLNNLIGGRTATCGRCCKNEEKVKHGCARRGGKTPEYRAWADMISRCYNPGNISYKNYGGRGIKVCDRWRFSFESFLADMGPKPDSRSTLDRIDPNGDYSPGNCWWATQKEQNNNKRNNILLTFNGKTATLMQWAETTGINFNTLHARIRRYGWPIEVALTTKPWRGNRCHTIIGDY